MKNDYSAVVRSVVLLKECVADGFSNPVLVCVAHQMLENEV